MKSEKQWKSAKFQGAEDNELRGVQGCSGTHDKLQAQTGLGKQQLGSGELKMPSLPQLSHWIFSWEAREMPGKTEHL